MPKKEGEELINWIERRPELDYIRTTANKTLCDYRLDENELSERIVVNNTADKSFGKENFFRKFLGHVLMEQTQLKLFQEVYCKKIFLTDVDYLLKTLEQERMVIG